MVIRGATVCVFLLTAAAAGAQVPPELVAYPSLVLYNGSVLTVDRAFTVAEAVAVRDGRWKLLILFHLFGGQVRRFSDLERAIPAISQIVG